MNNNQPAITKQPKQSRIRLSLACGLILMLLMGLLLPFMWRSESRDARHFHDVLQFSAVAIGMVGLVVLLFSYLFANLLRRIFRRELLPRYVFAFACFATLIAAFYAIENWRGKRAWEKARKQLEAKGAVLDWAAYIPAPIPDDQNFYKAPKMAEWFVRTPHDRRYYGQTFFARLPDLKQFVEEKNAIAHVSVDSFEKNPLTEPNAVYDYKKSTFNYASSGMSEASFKETLKLLNQHRSGDLSSATAPKLEGAQNITLVAINRKALPPLRVSIRANEAPTAKEVEELFSQAFLAPLHVEKRTNGFRVSLKKSDPTEVAVQDYLEWTEQFQPELELIRTALKRSHARIDGNYERPFTHPIPNYVSIRLVAQMLSQRAQCYLLLNEPEKAWAELTALHELSEMVGTKNQPLLVVSAMISVALAGIYESVIADGFRLQVWDEPQIDAIARQLQNLDLMGPLAASLKTEQAGASSTLANSTSDQVSELMFPPSSRDKNTLWRKMKNPAWLMFKFAPRGWVYQNIASVQKLPQFYIEGMSQDGAGSMPQRIKKAWSTINKELENPTPYNFIASIAIPNFSRAWETAARNQTIARQLVIVCALERYRLAEKAYPDSLNALVPQYLTEIPREIINGEPLQYRRTDDGNFLLYSVGWDENDDGGLTSTKPNEPTDWVW